MCRPAPGSGKSCGQSPIGTAPTLGYLRGNDTGNPPFFILIYATIVFEHPLGANNWAAALLGSDALLVVYGMAGPQVDAAHVELAQSLRLSPLR